MKIYRLHDNTEVIKKYIMINRSTEGRIIGNEAPLTSDFYIGNDVKGNFHGRLITYMVTGIPPTYHKYFIEKYINGTVEFLI
jgi:hypothetical protein